MANEKRPCDQFCSWNDPSDGCIIPAYATCPMSNTEPDCTGWGNVRANEKRLIDANALRLEMQEYVFPITANNLMGAADAYYRILHLLGDAPTVDAVEVVRCKNCVCSFKSGDELLCSQFYEKLVHEDDYCSFGERRTEYEKNT